MLLKPTVAATVGLCGSELSLVSGCPLLVKGAVLGIVIKNVEVCSKSRGRSKGSLAGLYSCRDPISTSSSIDTRQKCQLKGPDGGRL